MAYSEGTYDSPNPICRFSHGSRFEIGKSILRLPNESRVLDYGCGDGFFLESLSREAGEKNLHLVGFDPIMTPVETKTVQFIDDLAQIHEVASFDVIFCLEVLEHFNESTQRRMVRDFEKHLKPDGKIVVSVPIEVGPVSLIKNAIRKWRDPRAPSYRPVNILKSLMYAPPAAFRQPEGYLDHMGFDYRILQRLLNETFRIQIRQLSPFSSLPVSMNSQIFWVLERKQ